MNNVILFATDDFGGAGKAALRIVKALVRDKKKCKMLVKNKAGNDNDVIRIYSKTNFSFDKRLNNYENHKKISDIKIDNKYYFGYKYDDIMHNDISQFIDFIPDTIIVTWITWFVSPRTVSEFASYYGANIIIWPLDMSLFTGGCHYAWDCEGFEDGCQNCPAIISSKHKYVAVNRLNDKKKYWAGKNVEFWSCSSSIYSELLRSSLSRNQKINKVFIPIDEEIFNNNNRFIAKNIFNISASDKVILFGSSFSFEARKGINFFIESINLLYNMLSSDARKLIKILVAGGKGKERTDYKIPFDVIEIDFIKDDLLLSHLYQASDVLVCPSIQDSGPMMINEAQMCGLPVIAFNIGVVPDFIVDNLSGFICDMGDVEQMAMSIKKFVLGEIYLDNDEIANSAFKKTSFTSFASFINS